jgi:CubicO group peptidase (beta-lactamase class C family)
MADVASTMGRGTGTAIKPGGLSRRQLIRNIAGAAMVSAVGAPDTAGAQNQDRSARVRKLLEDLIKAGPEIGLQVAVYQNGKLVVDVWAGLADQDKKTKVDGDTMFMLSSTTKGVTSTCMHVLVERHKVDYDMPIVKVWPEFGAHGKDKATLRHALSHQTGVPQTPVGYTPDWLADWDRMCRGIADLTPMFAIGQRTAYHSLNFGYINGEILRRVDGRPIGRFLQEEICAPLKIDGLYLGVPDSQLRRVAVLKDGPPAPADYDASMVGEPAGSHVATAFNRTDVIKAAIPGSGGIMSARGLARHYAMLANWGELDGVRILPEARVRAAIELQSFEWDEVYKVRVRRSLGYRRGRDCGPLAAPDAFGHVGGGGSFGYADPSVRLAIALAKNYFTYNTGSSSARPAPNVIAAAVFEAIGLKRT